LPEDPVTLPAYAQPRLNLGSAYAQPRLSLGSASSSPPISLDSKSKDSEENLGSNLGCSASPAPAGSASANADPAAPDTAIDGPIDPRQRIIDAVAFIGQHRQYLETKFQRSLFLEAEHIVGSGRRLSPLKEEILLEIEAVVRGMAAFDNEEVREDREHDRRTRHFLDKKNPGHPRSSCDLCAADAKHQAEAKAQIDEDCARMKQEWIDMQHGTT
jgi:hypothetical protein